MLLNTQHVQKSTKISARSLLSHSFKGKNNNSIKNNERVMMPMIANDFDECKLTGRAFEEEISKLAVSGSCSSSCSSSFSSLVCASTWGGELIFFSKKEYVGRFTSSRSVSSSTPLSPPILDFAFSPSRGRVGGGDGGGSEEARGCVCFATLSGELLAGDVSRINDDDDVKVVGTHDEAIKHVFFLEDKPDVVFSAGWDLHLNAWDLRMPSRSRKILSTALPFKPHVADAKNNRVLFVSAEGKTRRYDSSVILLTNAPSSERTSRSFINRREGGGQDYQHVRSCALSENPKHSYGSKREEDGKVDQPPCDFVLGLSNSKCSVEFFRDELDEKYAYNFLCHRETVRSFEANVRPKFAYQQQQYKQQQRKKNQQFVLQPINGCAFVQQPSANLLVTGGGDGKLELWSTKTREHLETVCDFKKGSSISTLAVNYSGDTIAVAVNNTRSNTRNVFVKHLRPDEIEET